VPTIMLSSIASIIASIRPGRMTMTSRRRPDEVTSGSTAVSDTGFVPLQHAGWLTCRPAS
jgi:hypothetical protein